MNTGKNTVPTTDSFDSTRLTSNLPTLLATDLLYSSLGGDTIITLAISFAHIFPVSYFINHFFFAYFNSRPIYLVFTRTTMYSSTEFHSSQGKSIIENKNKRALGDIDVNAINTTTSRDKKKKASKSSRPILKPSSNEISITTNRVLSAESEALVAAKVDIKGDIDIDDNEQKDTATAIAAENKKEKERDWKSVSTKTHLLLLLLLLLVMMCMVRVVVYI